MCFDGVLLQFLLPLIIEKLDSDVQSAKLDSLQTLVKTSQFICFFFFLMWMIYCWRSIKKSSKSEQRPTESQCVTGNVPPACNLWPHFCFFPFRLLVCHIMSTRTWPTSWKDCGHRCAGRSAWQMFTQSVELCLNPVCNSTLPLWCVFPPGEV